MQTLICVEILLYKPTFPLNHVWACGSWLVLCCCLLCVLQCGACFFAGLAGFSTKTSRRHPQASQFWPCSILACDSRMAIVGAWPHTCTEKLFMIFAPPPPPYSKMILIACWWTKQSEAGDASRWVLDPSGWLFSQCLQYVCCRSNLIYIYISPPPFF